MTSTYKPRRLYQEKIRFKHWTTQELETERDELIHSIADETVKLLEIQKELEYRPYLTKKDMK